MCGRYVLAVPPDELATLFDAEVSEAIVERAPSFNVAPTDDVAALRVTASGRVIDVYRWGLVPWWAKDRSVGSRAFNARAEGVDRRPLFRDAFASRRAAVLADGFYEWRKTGEREPFYFTRRDGAPLAFAGLYEHWRDPAAGGAWLATVTIITTQANGDLAGVHDRMPVVLEPDAIDVWIEPDGGDRDELLGLLHAAPAGTLVARPVGRAVGNVRNNGPELLEPIP